ncbi:MAG: hypothetical protein ACR2JE_04635 [Acidobacteriaceae bacterium]
MSTVNTVFEEHSHSPSKLTMKLMHPEENELSGYVLIEGDRVALQFLANLILAQLGETDCGLQIHPKAAGSLHFDSSSDLGLYIHVIRS